MRCVRAVSYTHLDVYKRQVKESLINAIVVFLKGMHVNAAWNIYYFILGMRQVRGRGTSKGRRG